MDPKQQALRNKQKERQQRGSDFQDEIRRGWRLVPNIWTINLKDGGGQTNAADRLIIAEEVNILAELKRTASQKFELNYLRPNQIKGLIDFDQVVDRNYGLVLVSFHNPGKGIDEAYGIRLTTALRYMQKKDRRYIGLEELQAGTFPAIKLPRLDNALPTYDLRGLITCYKSL